MDITTLFNRAAPNARAAYKTGLAAALDQIEAAGINTDIRICHFVAQILHESGRCTALREGMTYTTQARLLAVFGEGNHSAGITAAEAPALLRNPEALGERVYGQGNPEKAAELGNDQPGDGYKFRGGGALQTTGRFNYQRVKDATEIDVIADPDLIVKPAISILPALQFWTGANLNGLADANKIRAITKAINGGTNGLPDRKALFQELWAIAVGTAPPAFGD